MTAGDWALFIGLLINAAATLFVMRNTKIARSEDQARMGQVANKAASVARMLVNKQNETQAQLNQIHANTNSNLTREMQERLAALRGQVALTKEVIRLNKINKLNPVAETQMSLDTLEAAVNQLEIVLSERGGQTTEA